MADKNNDGIDDETGDPVIVVGQGGAPVPAAGAPSSNVTLRPGGDGVTIATPKADTDGAWFPKISSGDPFAGSIPSSGALSQWTQGLANPESAIYNETQAKSSLEAAVNRPTQYGKGTIFEIVAAGRGRNTTANGVMQGYIAESAAYNRRGIRVTPQQLAYQEALDKGWITSDGSIELPARGGGGPRGGSGPAAPTPSDPSAIRRAMDQVTMGLIGRTLSDKEFNKYYSQYVGAFSGNPDMDPAQHMIERTRKDEDYQEYQVATKFAGALDAVLRGAA